MAAASSKAQTKWNLPLPKVMRLKPLVFNSSALTWEASFTWKTTRVKEAKCMFSKLPMPPTKEANSAALARVAALTCTCSLGVESTGAVAGKGVAEASP